MENKITQFIFDKVGIPKQKKYLDMASLRHKLISGNVANVSTPQYEAKDIDFHSEFKKVTKAGNRVAGVTTHQNHIPTGQHQMKPPKIDAERVKSDELNSVNIDKEISNLTQNELLYDVGATLLQRKFEGLRKVIQSK